MAKKESELKEIDGFLIERDYDKEYIVGIEELCFYIYEEGCFLNIFGEIYGNEVWDDLYFVCILYDQDGDPILSEENSTYEWGLFSSNVIKRDAFFNGFPFSFCISKPETPISRIKIVPERC